jgi:hypothetical protein
MNLMKSRAFWLSIRMLYFLKGRSCCTCLVTSAKKWFVYGLKRQHWRR